MRRARGFTLVEVSLAILVVGLGLLAVFSLFPSGMNLSKSASDDTQAAMFAEEALNGMRAKIDGSASVWSNLSSSWQNVPTMGMWTNANLLIITNTHGLIRTNIYKSWGGEEDALRYSLQFGTQYVDRVKSARLRVWAGRYGRTDNPVEFYTEFYNFRSPPENL